jgi:hypothetical protein
LRWVITVLLMTAVLLAGFCVTEVLLQVSELPPAAVSEETKTPHPAPAQVTQPPETTAAPKPKPLDLRAVYSPVRMLDSRERTRRIITQAGESGANAPLSLYSN